jgi:hypothetical protein
MKKFAFACISLFLMLFALMGCTGYSSNNTHTKSSASWAYPFVRVNGVLYGISNNEIDKSEVGKKIGEVKRNVEKMDSGPDKYFERNFDSNELDEGTPLFEDLKDPTAIVFKKSGKFFLAKKSNK